MSEDDRSSFEVIRDTLLQMDPETRYQAVEAMKALRALPRPVAARVLSEAGARARLWVHCNGSARRYAVTWRHVAPGNAAPEPSSRTF